MQFLKEVIEDLKEENILDINSNDFSKVAIVFHTKRAKSFFSKLLQEDEDIKKPFFYPSLFSMEEFIEELSGKKFVDNFSIFFKLYEAYKDVFKDEKYGFDQFSKIATTLLSDFGDLDISLVDTDKFFKNMNEIANIEKNNINNTEEYGTYLEYMEKIGEVYKTFFGKFADNETYYKRAIRELNENFPTEKLEKFSHIIFAGFFFFPKGEEEIIKKIENEMKGKVKKYFEWNKYYDDIEPGKFVKSKDIKKFVEDGFLDKNKNIDIVGVAGNVGMAKYAGHILKEFKKGNFEDTVVVLPDETILFPLLSSLPDNVEKFNVTMGYPIKNSSAYALFKIVFSLFITSKGNRFNINELISFFSNPLIKLVLKESNKEENENGAIINRLKEKKKVFFEKEEICEIVKDETIQNLFSSYNSMSEFLLKITSVINSLGNLLSKKENRKRFVIESEFIFYFYTIMNRIIDQIEKMELKENELSISSLFNFLDNMFSTQKMPFSGELFDTLQIMGFLETRALNFKNVIILSVNEGVLPPQKKYETFIPLDVRNSYNLPSYKNNDAFYAYTFYRLINSAENITLIYNSETESLGKGNKSRFIEQLKFETKFTITEKIESMPIKLKGDGAFTIKKTDEIIERMKNIKYSPHSLMDYMVCPLRFYFKYVAQIREYEESDLESIDKRDLGNILHKVFKEILNNPENDVEEIVKKEYESVVGQDVDLTKGINRVYFDFIKEIAKKFEDKENNVSKIICYLEKEKEGSFEVNSEKISVKLKGFIDRVDKVKDRTGKEIVRIIDYKTDNTDDINNDIEMKITL
ncbi:MAG: hypothetical protein B6I28_04680, partial [Fusobacteriia bacterium 4572_132]